MLTEHTFYSGVSHYKDIEDMLYICKLEKECHSGDREGESVCVMCRVHSVHMTRAQHTQYCCVCSTTVRWKGLKCAGVQ